MTFGCEISACTAQRKNVALCGPLCMQVYGQVVQLTEKVSPVGKTSVRHIDGSAVNSGFSKVRNIWQFHSSVWDRKRFFDSFQTGWKLNLLEVHRSMTCLFSPRFCLSTFGLLLEWGKTQCPWNNKPFRAREFKQNNHSTLHLKQMLGKSKEAESVENVGMM